MEPDQLQPPHPIEEPPTNPAQEPEFRQLPKEALTAELLSALIFWGTATLGLIGGSTVLLLSQMLRSPWLYLGIFAAWTLLTVWSFGWPVLSHRRTFFRATEIGLEIKRGVLWQKHHFVPRSRVQHSDINQGPFQRRLGIARLVVYTAGSTGHTTALTGVTMADAQTMRNILTGHQGNDDGV